MPPPPLAERFSNSLKNDGLVATVRKCLGAPVRQWRAWQQRYRQWRFDHSSDAKVIFRMAYKLNYWASPESVSGPGSTLAYTANLRHHLPLVFARFSIQSVFDAPCGDFNWMKLVVAAHPIRYQGGDLVPALITANRTAHGNERTKFLICDITRDEFPETDLWICRDCLFHLSYREIYAALENFSRSRVRYILVTNHSRRVEFVNRDIRTGGCRMLDLTAGPFHLPTGIKYRIQEGPDANSGHEMCLWERAQITAALPTFASALAAAPTEPA